MRARRCAPAAASPARWALARWRTSSTRSKSPRPSCSMRVSPSRSPSWWICSLRGSLTSPSVAPALEVGPRGGALQDAFHDLGREHLMVAQPRVGVGPGVVPVPAVLGAVAVVHEPAVERVLRGLQEVLHEVDRVVQVVVVHVPAVEVDLPLELPPEAPAPLAAQDVAEVVVLAPVLGDRAIDDPRPLVPDRLRVAVGPHRRVDGLPDVPLPAGAAVRAEHELQAVRLLDRRRDVAQVVAVAGTRHLLEGALG